LSDEARRLIIIINLVILSSTLGVFGIIANIINIIIFYKQGLHTPVNIGFMGLAFSDLFGLVTLEWYCLCFNPLFVGSDVNIVPSEVQHLTAGFPHAYFARTTAWITVYLTAERCLCIVAPLKVNRILTPARAAVTICCIYFILLLPLVPEYSTVHLSWRTDPETNVTLLGIVLTNHLSGVDGLSFLLYAIIMVASFPLVVLLTAILIFKLRQKTKWRQTSAPANSRSENVSKRDSNVIRTVVVIACLLIACYTPSFLFSTVGFAVPGFSILGRHRNSFLAMATFGFLFDAANSSVTIICYFKMSTKYR
ncbi:unnamed protein product, partial [Lymnaea stagnalis]